jgi:hypothetical protein
MRACGCHVPARGAGVRQRHRAPGSAHRGGRVPVRQQLRQRGACIPLLGSGGQRFPGDQHHRSQPVHHHGAEMSCVCCCGRTATLHHACFPSCDPPPLPPHPPTPHPAPCAPVQSSEVFVDDDSPVTLTCGSFSSENSTAFQHTGTLVLLTYRACGLCVDALVLGLQPGVRAHHALSACFWLCCQWAMKPQCSQACLSTALAFLVPRSFVDLPSRVLPAMCVSPAENTTVAGSFAPPSSSPPTVSSSVSMFAYATLTLQAQVAASALVIQAKYAACWQPPPSARCSPLQSPRRCSFSGGPCVLCCSVRMHARGSLVWAVGG